MTASPATFAFGPGLIGAFGNVFLFGLELWQATVFFACTTTGRRRTHIDTLAALILLADAAQSTFSVVWVYRNLIQNFNRPETLELADWVFATDPALVAVVSTLVQIFYGWRLLTFATETSYLRLVAITVFVLSIVSGISGFATAVVIHYVPRYIDFPKFQAPVAVWIISSVVCDIMITASTSHYLLMHTEAPAGTRRLLQKLVIVTIHNGAITTLWATLDLVVYLFVPTGLHIGFNLPLGKLYSNLFFLSLNLRQSLIAELRGDGIITVDTHEVQDAICETPAFTFLRRLRRQPRTRQTGGEALELSPMPRRDDRSSVGIEAAKAPELSNNSV